MHVPPNAVVPVPPWYDPAKISRDATLGFRPLGGSSYGDNFIGSFAVTPADQIDLADVHAQTLAVTYGTDAGFMDVGTYLPPVLNLDASDGRSTTWEQGIRNVKTAMLRTRGHHQGPLSGEAYAMPSSWDLIFAGYVDGLERELVGGEDGLIIPDVELRVFQPRQANQGMGYLSRFFAPATRDENDFPAERHHDLIRSRTVAFGHTGFVSDTMVADPRDLLAGVVTQTKVMSDDQILKEYFLHQALQKRMLAGPVSAITYWDGTSPKTLGQKLQEIRSATTDVAGFVAAAASYFGRARVGIAYANGLEIRVNGHRTADWTVTVQGETWILPPSGWLAIRTTGGEYFRALVARRYGIPGTEITGWVVAPEYSFLDDRNLRIMTILVTGRPGLFVPY